eukprot:TRINITY_DN25911_c0_g1_i2.p1 TRINITY_DN25911_c0_g1~~TRINITY_DN25911_c0_g1_i2.p1  ORF type:complete len:497 (+),score=15.04 TRINITY_DN25911_c0_g1_i2:147-1493(+)
MRATFIEVRLLPKLPAIPGQVRLWMGNEAYAYGDYSDKRYRSFNRISPHRLASRNFCPLPLHLFPYQEDDGSKHVPFWSHYPLADLRAALLERQMTDTGRTSTRICITAAHPVVRQALQDRLPRLGWTVVQDRVPGFYDFYLYLATCRYIIYMPQSNGKSQGRGVADGAILGIPVFGLRRKFLTRLLMPPYFSVVTAEDIEERISYLSANPHIEDSLRKSVWMRSRLIDIAGGPDAENLAEIARVISDGDSACSLSTTSRLEAQQSDNKTAPRHVEALISSAIIAEDPDTYLESWLNSAAEAFRSTFQVQPLGDCSWIRRLEFLGPDLCFDNLNLEKPALFAAGAYRCIDSMPTSPEGYALFGLCLTRLSEGMKWDNDLLHAMLLKARSALQKWKQMGQGVDAWESGHRRIEELTDQAWEFINSRFVNESFQPFRGGSLDHPDLVHCS